MERSVCSHVWCLNKGWSPTVAICLENFGKNLARYPTGVQPCLCTSYFVSQLITPSLWVIPSTTRYTLLMASCRNTSKTSLPSQRILYSRMVGPYDQSTTLVQGPFHRRWRDIRTGALLLSAFVLLFCHTRTLTLCLAIGQCTSTLHLKH